MTPETKTGPHPASVRILGVRIDCVDDAYILARMRDALNGGSAVTITYAHFETVLLARENPALRSALEDADIVFPDGVAMYLTLRLMHGVHLRRFTGPDLNQTVLESLAHRRIRVLFAGGTTEVAHALPAVLTGMGFDAECVSVHDGWTSRSDDEWRAIASSHSPAVIILGMGGTRQSVLLHTMASLPVVRVVLAVGAFFDLLTGRTRRAPRWMRTIGLEWLGRLVQEPRRLWRRYVIGIPRFVWMVIRSRRG